MRSAAACVRPRAPQTARSVYPANCLLGSGDSLVQLPANQGSDDSASGPNDPEGHTTGHRRLARSATRIATSLTLLMTSRSWSLLMCHRWGWAPLLSLLLFSVCCSSSLLVLFLSPSAVIPSAVARGFSYFSLQSMLGDLSEGNERESEGVKSRVT